jgi:hypothetical protein
MPTAAATRPSVETKEGPEVVVDVRLNRLVEAWAKSEDAKDGAWLQIAKHVRDKKCTSAQVFAALVKIRGLKESSARVEASRFMRFTRSKEASDMLDEALSGGDISIRDLRSARVMTGERAEVSDDEKYEKKLISVARFALEKGAIEEEPDFIRDCRRAFRLAKKKVTAVHQAAAGDGEEEEAAPPEEEEEE